MERDHGLRVHRPPSALEAGQARVEQCHAVEVTTRESGLEVRSPGLLRQPARDALLVDGEREDGAELLVVTGWAAGALHHPAGQSRRTHCETYAELAGGERSQCSRSASAIS